MTARRRSLADKMARAAGQQPAEPAATEPAATEPARPVAAPLTKKVRITVDLDPMEYRALPAVQARLAELTGVAKVATADVVRVLLAELEAAGRNPDPGPDGDLMGRVAARLRDRAAGRR